MARYTGKAGNITFATGWDSKVLSWTLHEECDSGEYVDADLLAGGNLFVETTEGVHRWNGQYIVNSDDATAVPGAGIIGNAIFTEKPGRTWSGQIRIISLDSAIEVGSEGLVQYTFSYKGHGTLTRPS